MSRSDINRTAVPQSLLKTIKRLLICLRANPLIEAYAQCLARTIFWLEHPESPREEMVQDLAEFFRTQWLKDQRTQDPFQKLSDQSFPAVELSTASISKKDLVMLIEVCRKAPDIAATKNARLIEAFADAFHNVPDNISRNNFNRAEFSEFVIRQICSASPDQEGSSFVKLLQAWSRQL